MDPGGRSAAGHAVVVTVGADWRGVIAPPRPIMPVYPASLDASNQAFFASECATTIAFELGTLAPAAARFGDAAVAVILADIAYHLTHLEAVFNGGISKNYRRKPQKGEQSAMTIEAQIAAAEEIARLSITASEALANEYRFTHSGPHEAREAIRLSLKHVKALVNANLGMLASLPLRPPKVSRYWRELLHMVPPFRVRNEAGQFQISEKEPYRAHHVR